MKPPTRDFIRMRDFIVLLLLYLAIVTSFITCRKETVTRIKSLSVNMWQQAPSGSGHPGTD